MLDNKSISWTSFCQTMNSIVFWLIQNKMNYKKRDYYQILNLYGNCSDIEKKAKKLGKISQLNVYNGINLR